MKRYGARFASTSYHQQSDSPVKSILAKPVSEPESVSIPPGAVTAVPPVEPLKILEPVKHVKHVKHVQTEAHQREHDRETRGIEKVELIGAIIDSPVIVRPTVSQEQAEVYADGGVEAPITVEMKKHLTIYTSAIPYNLRREFMREFFTVFRKDEHTDARIENAGRRNARENAERHQKKLFRLHHFH